MSNVCVWLESNPIELGDGVEGGTASFPFTSSLTKPNQRPFSSGHSLKLLLCSGRGPLWAIWANYFSYVKLQIILCFGLFVLSSSTLVVD